MSPEKAMTESDSLMKEKESGNGICSRCMKYVNFIGIVALSIMVGFMFLQLQSLTYRINKDEIQIKKMSQQIQAQENGQQEQMNQLNSQVEKNQSLTTIQMAGTLVLLTCLLTMFHMTSHLRNFFIPVIQRKVIAILWMSPIYALTAFFSIVAPVLEAYLAVIKDFYEAYVIYTFLSYLIAVLGKGDRDTAVEVLTKHSDNLKPPARCFRRFYHPPPEESPRAKVNAVLVECQILAMQFVFCRPILSIASLVTTSLTEEDNDDIVQRYFTSPQFCIDMIQNISILFAFRGLLKFYHMASDDLQWINPFSKFLCIKGVVFMTFWQGLLIDIVVSLKAGGKWSDENSDNIDPREHAMIIQNVIICLEMLFFSIAHWCAFPVDEYEEGYRREKMPKPGIGFSDFVSDVGGIIESSAQHKLSKQMKNGDYVGTDDLENITLEMHSDIAETTTPEITTSAATTPVDPMKRV